MKLKKTSILFMLLPLCIFFTACSKENDNAPKQSENIIDFEQGNMNFTEGAGEQTFSFTTNTAWVVSVASTRNGEAPWCTVAPTSGNAGSHTIKVTTTPNETYDDRSVTVTLKAGAEVKSFVVSQKQKDALLLTNDKFEVDQAGGTVTVEVKSNVSYTAIIGEECKDWIKESNSTRALSATTKSYTVAMNEDGKKREGSIIFSDGSLTETVHIYQAGGSIILLSQNDCHVSASGEEITVELRSNCDYEVVMPSVDWIKETMTRGMSSHTLHYTVAPNDSYDGRKAEIIYRDKSDNNIADTLTILQAQKDAIIISEKEVKVGSEGGTVEVKIDANVDFEMQLPDVEWISETSTRGLSTHKKYLKIAENTGETSRTAEVVFKNTTSGIEETLTVSQSAKGKRVKVHVEKPGTLSDYITESDKYTIEELEVSGNLGGLDIALICDMAGRKREHAFGTNGVLKRLDMSKATIIGDGEYYVYGNWGGPQVIYSYPKDNVIGDHMFASTKLESIVLPDNVTEIEYDAFSICHELSNVAIPDGVKRIGQFSFSSTPKLKSITIPRSMNTIEESAFAHADGLTNIRIPGNIKAIEDGAFYGCKNLTSITIENGLGNIGSSVFYECKNLERIVLPESVSSIGGSCFSGCDNLSYIKMPTALYAFDDVFSHCSGLKNVVIPEGVTAIGHHFFGYCTNLESISFPNTLNKIGSRVFASCTSLSGRIEIPTSVSSMGGACFLGCHDITLSIPAKLVCENGYLYGDNMSLELVNDGTTSIAPEAFSGWSGLVSITMPNCITSIGENAFSGTGLKEVTIPNSVTTVMYGTFMGCKNLVKIDIPNSVTVIGGGAFSGCGITEIEIPNSVTVIGGSAFAGCGNLTEIEIPNSVMSIGGDCFKLCNSLQNITIPGRLLAGENVLRQCTGLKHFTIPEGTEVIGRGCFRNCTALESIDIPNTVTTIEGDAFHNCTSLRSVTIPNSVKTVGASFYGCSNLSDIKVPDHLYETSIFSGTGITDITVPEGTTAVGGFTDCTKLTSITFPEGVKALSDFSGCSSLRAIDIPDGVSVIGLGLFEHCTKLTKVTIPSSVVSLGSFAFHECSSLTHIVIPNHVATIGGFAFADCPLTSVTLGSGVTSIEELAFHNAPIRQLRCYAVVPPKLPGVVNGSFSADLVKGATLYVPAGTGMAYSESDWKIYFENIVEMEE